MKKNAMPLLFAIIYMFAITATLQAQSVKITSVNPTTYPEVKVEFFGYNKEGANVRNYNTNEIEIRENGVRRNVLWVDCPPEDLSRFSLILVLDLSGSMGFPIDPPRDNRTLLEVAKSAIRSFVASLPHGRFECALTGFSIESYLLHDFTDNKNLILSALDSFVVTPKSLTDYNAALLYDNFGNPGALRIAEKAKYKTFVLFLTDGVHDMWKSHPRSEVWMNEIIKKADSVDATIYSIALNLQQTTILTEIALGPKNKGKMFGSVDQRTIDQVYQEILQDIEGAGIIPPCDVVYMSACDGGEMEMTIPKLDGAKVIKSFVISDALKPYLEVTKRNFEFKNIPPGTSVEEDVTITAKKNYVNVTGQNFTDSRIQVTDWGGSNPPFKLDKDASRKIKVKYNANDSAYINGRIDLISTACEGNDIHPASTWIIIKDVDMGTQTLNQTKEEEKYGVFCNRSGKTIRINNASITGFNFEEFIIINPPANMDLPNGECIKFIFRFTPKETGKRTAVFTLNTSEGAFVSEIFGNGSGKANIETVDEISFNAVDCKNLFYEEEIDIKNPGALPLNISSFSIDNPAFSFVPNNPGPQVIDTEGSMKVTVKYQPTVPGQTTGNLTITSDADNAPNLVIPLSGVKHEHKFTTSVNTIDFGFVCPDEKIERQLEIENTGNVELKVNAVTENPFSLPTTNWTIPPGEKRQVTIEYSANTSGTKNLVFTDDYCNFSQTVSLSATLDPVVLQSPLLSIVASVGSSTDKVVNVKNNTKREVTITNASFSDPQFTLVSPLPPIIIASGGNKDITVKYSPTNNQEINETLTLSGEPCDFDYDVQLEGLPFASTAEIEIAKFTSLIGEDFQAPVRLANTQNLDQSGTNAISFDISFRADVLRPKAPTPGGVTNAGITTISFVNLPIIPSAGNQTLVTLNFEALDTETPCSDIEISNVNKTNGYLVITKTSKGEFCQIPAYASIEVGKINAVPGKKVDLQIYMKNPLNVSAFHQSINAKLTMNAYLLDPVENFDETVVNGIRTINMQLPVTPLNSEGLLKTISFTAMLGNAEKTDIILFELESVKGKINFDVTQGEFILDGICNDGKPGETPRLFDPNGGTALGLLVSPNPANRGVSIDYTLAEDGMTQIWISDVLGNNVMQVHSGFLKIGEHKQEIDCTLLSSGSYFIILRTPTALMTKRLDILK